MMYSEFAEAIGCRDNEHNHKVFRDLEVMYMNSDITKEQVYEYGRKLVDNSKSEAQLRLEAEIKAEMDACKTEIESNKREMAYRKYMAEQWKADGDKNMADHEKAMVRFYRDENKKLRNRIAALKWVLA